MCGPTIPQFSVIRTAPKPKNANSQVPLAGNGEMNRRKFRQ